MLRTIQTNQYVHVVFGGIAKESDLHGVVLCLQSNECSKSLREREVEEFCSCGHHGLRRQFPDC